MSSSSDPQCTPAQPPPPDPPHQPPPLDPPHQPLHQPPQQSAASAALAAPVTGAAEPRPQSPALAASFIADVEPRPQSPARPPPHHQTLQQPPPLLPDPPPLLPQPMQEPPPLQQQPPPPLQQQEPVVAAQPLQQQPPPPLQQQPPPPTMVATPLQQQPPPPLQQQQPRLQWQPPPPQHQPPPQPPPPQQPPDRLSLLRRPGSSSGFFGVTKERKGSAARPYLAQIQRDGRKLGRFSTALEAAHASVDAMTDEDATRLGAAPPLRDDGLSVEAAAEAAEAQAQQLQLTLEEAPGTKSGYRGVAVQKKSASHPFTAVIYKDGKARHLGCFRTKQEAALAYSRALADKREGRPEADAVEERELTAEEAEAFAEDEGLALCRASTQTGFKGVWHRKRSKSRPYAAEFRTRKLGGFATPEAAALAYARAAAYHETNPCGTGKGCFCVFPWLDNFSLY